MRVPSGLPIVLIEGAVFSVFAALLGLLSARNWGPQLAGIAALSFTIAALCAVVAQMGTDQVVIARFVGDRNPARLIRSVMLLRSMSSLLALLAAAAGTSMFSAALGDWVLLPLLFFLQCLLGVADVLRLRAQALNTLHRQSPWRMGTVALFFFAKMAAIMQLPAEMSIWLVAALSVAESAALLGISVTITRRETIWPAAHNDTAEQTWAEVLELVRASLPLFAAGLAVMAFLRLDYFALAKWADPHELGLYSACMRVLELYIAIGNLALLQFLPQLVGSHRSSAEEYQQFLRGAFGLAYLISAGIVGFNALVGASLIRWALGEEYAPVAAASTAVCLLAIPLLSGTVRGFAIYIQGLHAHHLYCALLGIALGVPLLAWLVPSHGFHGALWADGLTYFTTAMLSSLVFPRLRGIARAQWRPRLVLPKGVPLA